MVIDTSAIVAILSGEPEAEGLARALAADPVRRLSAATLLELTIVVETRYGDAGGRELELFLAAAGIEVVTVTAEQAQIARRAWRRFGKGRHPAALNLGDCLAYAAAMSTGEALLYKGADFAQTDVRAAHPAS